MKKNDEVCDLFVLHGDLPFLCFITTESQYKRYALLFEHFLLTFNPSTGTFYSLQ